MIDHRSFRFQFWLYQQGFLWRVAKVRDFLSWHREQMRRAVGRKPHIRPEEANALLVRRDPLAWRIWEEIAAEQPNDCFAVGYLSLRTLAERLEAAA